MGKKKILFITTSSLSANPRLLKELQTLKKSYECHVISFIHYDWTRDKNETFINENREVIFHQIDRKKQKLLTLLSKLIHHAARLANSFLKKNLLCAVLASNEKTSDLNFKLIKLRKYKFDRVVAHNLGAFYTSKYYSSKHNIPLQLDIEDYHPGEKTYYNHKQEVCNRKLIMQECFNKANAITYASAGIYKKCNAEFNIPFNTAQTTILNSFFSTDFKSEFPPKSKTIKCVWFSQHISHSRGLEKLFEAANEYRNVEFHLIGNVDHNYLNKFQLSKNIFTHEALPQSKLHEFLSKMDIGLALENTSVDENRGICLTNKILAYAQAGLYILATDTYGQRDFLTNLTYKAGEIINESLQKSLHHLNPEELLHEEKNLRMENAASFAWDQESKKLLSIVK